MSQVIDTYRPKRRLGRRAQQTRGSRDASVDGIRRRQAAAVSETEPPSVLGFAVAVPLGHRAAALTISLVFMLAAFARRRPEQEDPNGTHL